MLKNISKSTSYQSFMEKWKDNNEAQNFINLVANTDNCIFLTGKAGTGKTTLIKDIIDIAYSLNQPPLVLGSTGISALNVGGQTVHSFFNLGFDYIDTDNIPKFIEDENNINYKLKKSKIFLLEKVPFIIIDEISMLNGNIIDCIDFLLRFYLGKTQGNSYLKYSPFYGKQIIFVGDVFQLPPVIDKKKRDIALGNKNYKSERFFHSKVFSKLDYKGIELQKCYRQAGDRDFSELLDRIRTAEYKINDIYELRNKKVSETNRSCIYISTHKNNVNSENNKRLAEIPGKEYIFRGSTSGKFPDSMKKVGDELKIKIGAKVMFMVNDSDKGFVNGAFGMIKNIGINEDGDDCIQVYSNGQIYNVTKYLWNNEIIDIDKNGDIKKKIIGSYRQFPIQLGYAITIHKSQGLTFDTCQIDIENCFEGGQAYTALSRVKSINGLKIIGDIKENSIFTNSIAQKYLKNDFLRHLYIGKVINEEKTNNITYNNLSYMEQQKRIYKNAYKTWTNKDDELLMHLFKDKGLSYESLSNIFGRNIGGIISRLEKLGLVYNNYKYQYL